MNVFLRYIIFFKKITILFPLFIYSQQDFTIRGNVNKFLVTDSITEIRNCPGFVDSCLYVCDDGALNPCHPQNIYTIAIDTSADGEESTEGSRYRVYFPWEYDDMTADKFIVTASWPCLSPTAVYASGNYVFWDIYGNDECPGTVQGAIWYGNDCEDEYGNIGSNDCQELVGRFCFAPGDTLNWDENADQSIFSDVCDACWMSAPAWSYYDSNVYSDSLLSPTQCEFYDHCHHSTPDSILCGVGYMDNADTNSISIHYQTYKIKNYIISSYPNPFNSRVKLSYSIRYNEFISVEIFDVTGLKIKSFINRIQAPGKYEVYWNGKNEEGSLVAAGMYFYVLRTKYNIESNKIIFIK